MGMEMGIGSGGNFLDRDKEFFVDFYGISIAEALLRLKDFSNNYLIWDLNFDPLSEHIVRSPLHPFKIFIKKFTIL